MLGYWSCFVNSTFFSPNNYQALLNLMATREADMKQAVKLGQNLVLNADSSSPEVSSLRQEVKEIPDRFDELKNQLTEQQAELEKIIRDSTVFQHNIRELELWVTEVSESTAMQEPISTNPKVVHKRLELTEVSDTWPLEGFGILVANIRFFSFVFCGMSTIVRM